MFAIGSPMLAGIFFLYSELSMVQSLAYGATAVGLLLMGVYALLFDGWETNEERNLDDYKASMRIMDSDGLRDLHNLATKFAELEPIVAAWVASGRELRVRDLVKLREIEPALVDRRVRSELQALTEKHRC